MTSDLVSAAVLIPLLIGDKNSVKDEGPGGFRLKSSLGLVLLPPSTAVVLTVRTHTVEHHKGQISFPGGVFEQTDSSLEQTALRETFEEIGLDPENVEIVAELPEIPTVATRFRVKPFVGLVGPHPDFKPNPGEIGQIIVAPLSHFFQTEHSMMEYFERDGVRYPMRTYYFNEHRIWGATGRMLQTLLENFLEKR